MEEIEKGVIDPAAKKIVEVYTDNHEFIDTALDVGAPGMKELIRGPVANRLAFMKC